MTMKTLLVTALLFSAASPLLAREAKEPTPAQAACDEQVGEFRRDGANFYCDVNGVIYEGREELHAGVVPLRPLDAEREQREAQRRSTSHAGQQTEGLNLPQK